MRAWIDQGRVAATALVWRAGWPEWRSAAAIFPKLAATVAAPWTPAPTFAAAPAAPLSASPWGTTAPANSAPRAVAPVAPVGRAIAPVQSAAVATPAGLPVGQILGGDEESPIDSILSAETEDRAARFRRRRRQRSDVTMVVSIILVVLTIILVVVLGIVLSRQTEPAAGPPQMYHGPKIPDVPKDKSKEKSEDKSATKSPAKKKEQAKKAPVEKAKPADAMEMDDDSDDE